MDPISQHLFAVAAVGGRPTTQVDSFSYTTPGTYNYTVAAGRAISVDVIGAKGGTNSSIAGSGGSGGRTQGKYFFPYGGSIVIQVGADPGSASQGGAPGGGSGASGTYGPSTGGGGYSGIFINSVSHANAIFIAGGGGGHGWYNSGGSGGGLQGGTGGNTYGGGTQAQTTGGSQSAGGTNAYGTSGSALQGGNGASAGYLPGGGGGGGYYGGGGGSGGSTSSPPGVAGGGGGSGYVHPDSYETVLTSGHNSSGNGSVSIIVLG